MSEAPQNPSEPTEEPDEEEVRVADPQQYNQNQRLKEIHKARQEVADHVRDLEINESTGNTVYIYSITELAHKVALYVHELEPLMHRADVDSEMFELPESFSHDTVFEYGAAMGMKPDGNPVGVTESMHVFSRCNQFMAEVGLGADLDGGLPGDELEL